MFRDQRTKLLWYLLLPWHPCGKNLTPMTTPAVHNATRRLGIAVSRASIEMITSAASLVCRGTALVCACVRVRRVPVTLGGPIEPGASIEDFSHARASASAWHAARDIGAIALLLGHVLQGCLLPGLHFLFDLEL